VHYYTKQRSGTKRTVICLTQQSLKIHLGQVAAIHSTVHASGKNTFLKAVAQIFLPVKGFIYFPQNLRVRYVAKEPHLFNQCLMDNLRFGNATHGRGSDCGKPCYTDEEIGTLCRKLGIAVVWNRQEERFNEGWQNLMVGENGQKLSQSDCILICVARALLSSADLLLVGSSLDALNREQARTVLKVLREMVEESAVMEFAAERAIPKHLKKKKTVLIATAHPRIEKECHRLIKLDMDVRGEDEDDDVLVEEINRLTLSKQVEKLNQMASETKHKVLKKLKYREALTHFFDVEQKQIENMDARASSDFSKQDETIIIV